MMYAQSYDFFLFDPIGFATFSELFGPLYQSDAEARKGFNLWLSLFLSRSATFHHMQQIRLEVKADRDFRRSVGLRDDDPLEYPHNEEWDEYRAANNIDAIVDSCRGHLEDIYRLNQSIGGKRIMSASDIIRDYIESEDRRFILSKANSAWFNRQVWNTGDTVETLRSMPYTDYLKTRHWARVRAAALLIHGGRCQEKDDFQSGDSWYSGLGDIDIHVHHLSYENRGRERYEDIVLLCSMHHKQWHSEMDALGKSTIILADD
jgi:hypothetical protein